MDKNIKTLVGFLVLVALLLGISIAGERTVLTNLTGGSGFYSVRQAMSSDTYVELGLGPVTTGGSSLTYTATGLFGFRMFDQHLVVGLTGGSSGTSTGMLAVRHESMLSDKFGFGIQGNLLSTTGGSTMSLFSGSSIYAMMRI